MTFGGEQSHLHNDVIQSLTAMNTGLGLFVIIMAANPTCWTLCCFYLSSVMDLAGNFNGFRISEVNSGRCKSSFQGACEVVVTTKTKMHWKRALYYVITQMVY